MKVESKMNDEKIKELAKGAARKWLNYPPCSSDRKLDELSGIISEAITAAISEEKAETELWRNRASERREFAQRQLSRVCNAEHLADTTHALNQQLRNKLTALQSENKSLTTKLVEIGSKLVDAESENKSLKENNARLLKDLDDLRKGDATLLDIAVRNGAMTIEVCSEVARVLAQQFYTLLTEKGGENYLEMHLNSKEGKTIVVTVRWEQGKTPHQLRQIAEQERDALRAQIHDLCHDKHVEGPVKPEEFCSGCEEFQKKLFGHSPIQALREKVEKLTAQHKAFKAVVEMAWEDRREDSPIEYIGKLAEAKCNEDFGL